MEDWTEDPQQLAEIAAAAGLFDEQSPPLEEAQLVDPVRDLPFGGRKKIPCDGSVPQSNKDPEITTPNKELEEKVHKLGEVTLEGFERLSKCVKALEQQRNPSSFSLSSLNKGCLIAIFGYLAMLFGLGALAVVFKIVGLG